jgi:magnesium-transporting ATPase (P-type)
MELNFMFLSIIFYIIFVILLNYYGFYKPMKGEEEKISVFKKMIMFIILMFITLIESFVLLIILGVM